MDEKKALAIALSNTRRKSRSLDLFTVAEAIAYLVELYGGISNTAKKLGISPQMVREFLYVFDLPESYQKLVKTRDIDTLVKVKHLRAFHIHQGTTDTLKQTEGLNTDDLRSLSRLLKTTKMTIREASELVRASKVRGTHVFVLSISDPVYQKIKKISKSNGMEDTEFVELLLSRIEKLPKEILNNKSDVV